MTLEEVYHRHADFVWQTLRHLGLDEVDAEDAMQEVFLTVHRKLNSFEGKSALTTWLFTICRSIARDRRGRAYRRREVSDDETVSLQEDGSAGVEQSMEQRQRLEQLQTILDRMESSQREVFVLFELQGMSGEDIARLLMIPIGTVHSRLRLARTTFQAAVQRLQISEQHQKLHLEPTS